MCKVKNRKGEGYLCTRGRIDGEAKSKKKKLSSSKKEREKERGRRRRKGERNAAMCAGPENSPQMHPN